MILATYESPLGNQIELHYEGHFLTRTIGTDGPMDVRITMETAREHYEHARDNGGKLYAQWPKTSSTRRR